MITTKNELMQLSEKYKKQIESYGERVLVCGGTGCVASGSLRIMEKMAKLVADKGLLITMDMIGGENGECACGEEKCKSGIGVEKSGCHGFCEMGPLVRIEPMDILYCNVKEEDVEEIVNETLMNRKEIKRLLYHDPNTDEVFHGERDIPFYKAQTRIGLSNCGALDPDDIRNYIARDGYVAMAKALCDMTSEEVVQEMLESGLRGRGGGGFPTGRKWMFAQAEKADQKYVICNGDEGDPGAFMDRSIMEGDPHRVIEGLAIAGKAIGATKGYIYVRAEYPLAVARLKTALVVARENGILGKNIFGSGFDFDVRIKEGAGAFVCGEETALIASIEGERGMPKPRPPFPAVKGLFGKPTIINNVETLANVSSVILNGAKWFKSIGLETSSGTKTFALTGQVNNTGLIEVPMGSTVRDVIFNIGGGIKNNGKFKAVQMGGPSGGCLTEEHLDISLDFDSMQKVGAMIGSGGLVVMDETTCMVEIARFFMNFTQNESCGKCVPCREGTLRMLQILQKIVDGKATLEDVDTLEQIALVVKDSSLCALGKTAPNPVLTTLKYFRDEYIAHVVDGKCPAGACAAYKVYEISAEKCIGCTRCSKACPVEAISGEVKKPHVIDADKCIKCGACVETCKFGAISK